MRLLIVPQLRPTPGTRALDDFALEEPLLEQVTDVLESRRLVGTRIELTTPYYIGVTVEARIRVAAGRNAAAVRQEAESLLRTWLDPLDGGANATGWPFDKDLTAAAVTLRLEGVEGVTAVEDVRLYAYDGRTGERAGDATEILKIGSDSLFLPAEITVTTR